MNCYYFTAESKTWMECKQICQNYGSSLLKIDDADERVSWTITFPFILLDSDSHPWTQNIKDSGESRKRDLQLFFVLCLLREQKSYS